MSNPVISDEAHTFYKVLGQVRAYLTQTPDISLEDRQKIAELLRVLKYNVEFQILEDSLRDDSFITSVVGDIKTKLLHIDEERKSINESIKNNELLNNTRRLIALRRTSNELDRILTYIQNRQFSYYIEAMNEILGSTNELVIACSNVLAHGNKDYTHMFGKTVVRNDSVDKEGIDLLFSIVTDGDLKAELDRFLKIEEKYNAILEEKNSNKRFMELINLIKSNEVTFREYLKLRPVLSPESNASYLANRENLATSKLVLDNLKSDGLAGIFNKRQRDQLEIDILRYEADIKSYEEKKKEAEKLEAILVGVGLGDVVTALSNIVEGVELTIEEKVAAYLKASFKKSSFDIRPAQIRVSERSIEIDSRLAIASLKLNDVVSSLSNKAHKLVTSYHDDVVKMYSLFNTRKDNGFSPILAAYILKLLSDSRSLDYRDINDMCSLEVDIEAMFNKYALLHQEETRVIQEQLMEVREEEEVFTNGDETEQRRKI